MVLQQQLWKEQLQGLETRNSSYSITETKWAAAEAKFGL